jgi:hypothetical protein
LQFIASDDPHGPNEARQKLWHDAESHPDETDLALARQWAKRVMEDSARPTGVSQTHPDGRPVNQ